ncbi:MAG: sigma factor [Pseudonocardiales bacterium]
MDQHEWGQLPETVLRRTRASGASREDAEDAMHDALLATLAALEEPEHPQSEVAWLSIVARRRRVDLLRQRVREQGVRVSATSAPVSLPAVYRQLDEHAADSEIPYNLTTGLQQLTAWMAAPIEDSTIWVARAGRQPPGHRQVR